MLTKLIMATLFEVLLNFLISLIVSAAGIYLVTNFYGKKKPFATDITAALIGAVIYSISYYYIGTGFLAALIGGIAWLIALEKIYNIGWLKALLISIGIWIIVSLLSFLPTVAGPL